MAVLLKCHSCSKEQLTETHGSWETLYDISLCSRCRYVLAIEIKGSPEGKAWPSYEEIFDLYISREQSK